VATTVFNAVWEAGLPITARTAHALYISRYPAGRDATVNYPDVDLQFRNDTGRPIVLQGSFDESGILIRLLGGGPTRRVESQSGALEETARPPVERTLDPTLYVGERVVVSDGEPRREIRVARTVYEGDEVLYRETWYTAYRAEPKEVRVGTKPKPVERQPAPKEKTKGDGEPASGGSGSGYASTAAIPSASQAGMRVGRSVLALTQAWRVHPSARTPGGSLVRSTA
jgi:hypothetical protein